MINEKVLEGIITNIQRFSVHDGPGIRDVIFLKGCPLRCLWCSNPESQNGYPEIAFSKDRCIGLEECGICIKSCHINAISPSQDGKVDIHTEFCTNCGECIQRCPSKAIRFYGNTMTIQEVMTIINEDRDFYSRSDGGVTVSGGEPLYQAGFACELLKNCWQHGIHTAMETTGYGKWEDLNRLCQYLNLIFYDIKQMNTDKHKEITGVGNELILENLQKISRFYPGLSVVVRTPIIPGYNDSKVNIEATVEFISKLENVIEYELLPYHAFGDPKYRQLNREYLLGALKPPTEEHMSKLNTISEKVRSKKRNTPKATQ